MPDPSYRPKKLFTPEQANAMLPLIKAITADLMRLAGQVMERRRRLDQLTGGREMSEGDPYDDELAQIEEELEKDTRQLQSYVEELRQLGVEPKGLAEGLVDFPALMDDQIVFLCWKHGEDEVLYWHDLDSGFSGRQPLTAGASAGGGMIDEDMLDI